MKTLPGARVFVENAQGQLLFQLRSDTKNWGLLGGRPEGRETIVDCIRREVYEESRITLNGFIPLGYLTNDVITYPNGDQVHMYDLIVLVQDYTGEPVINDDESLELKFFSRSDLTKLDLISTVQPALEVLDCFLESQQFTVR